MSCSKYVTVDKPDVTSGLKKPFLHCVDSSPQPICCSSPLHLLSCATLAVFLAGNCCPTEGQHVCILIRRKMDNYLIGILDAGFDGRGLNSNETFT